MAMDAITPKDQIERADEIKRPSMEEAMDAVRTLLAWAGDDPRREGLIDTPKRVAKAYQEFFAGYEMDPVKELSRTFDSSCEVRRDSGLRREARDLREGLREFVMRETPDLRHSPSGRVRRGSGWRGHTDPLRA